MLPNLGESLPEGEEWSLLTDMLSPRSGGGGGRSANLNEDVPESAPGNVVQPVFLAVKRLTAARAAAPSAIALTEVKVREDFSLLISIYLLCSRNDCPLFDDKR